jgi:Uma2 family endonuclease
MAGREDEPRQEGDAAMSAQPVEYDVPEPTAGDDLAELLEFIANAPDDGYRYEILNGELVVTPPATEDHEGLLEDLRMALLPALPLGWRMYGGAGIIAGGQQAVPDLVILDEPIVRGGEQYRVRPVRLVVEVESTSTKHKDRKVKAESYAKQGIDAYWRIEKNAKTHVYSKPQLDGTWDEVRTVRPGETLKVTVPFEVELAPGEWL